MKIITKQIIETKKGFSIILKILTITTMFLITCGCQDFTLLSYKDWLDLNHKTLESWTFYYTGSQQNWVVPSGVKKIRITATGAVGGLGGIDAPGAGGQMIAEFNVIPGDTYYIFVGGSGGTGGNNGWNGGGIDGHANLCTYAGGATDIRYGGITLTNRIMVAGGGGGVGANGTYYGGFGAGTFNANGGAGQTATAIPESTGGGGGTQTAGGSGGTGNFGLSPANSGALGIGASNGDYGGAGGGGYYGGGSGGSGFSGNHSGGGGGSSYLNTMYGTFISGTDGFNGTTDGSVIIEDLIPK